MGTAKQPAVVNVQTEERSKEVAVPFEEKGWKYSIEVVPDKPKDIFVLERLFNPLKPKTAAKKVWRNKPCPC